MCDDGAVRAARGSRALTINFDVLRRWLLTRILSITFIRNITDIDDKILIKAAEQDRAWYNLAYDMKRGLRQGVRRVARAAAHLRARGHGPRPGDARADRPAGRARPCVRRSRTATVTSLDVQSWPSYRRADPAEGRRHGGGEQVRAASAILATSRCGRATRGPSRRRRPGPLHRVAVLRAGTSSAPRWREVPRPVLDIHGGGVDL